MIGQKARESIVTGWIKSSKEYSRILALRDTIANYITGQAVLVLTDSEKRFLEIAPLGLIQEQANFSYQFHWALKNVDEDFKGIPSDICHPWSDKYGEVYQTKTFCPLDLDYIEVTRPKDYQYKVVPALTHSTYVSGNQAVAESLKIFIQDYPISWEGLKELFLEYYRTASRLNQKYSALLDIMFNDRMTLQILKEGYPELYQLK